MRPYVALDHLSLPVADLERSVAFYDKALAPLGLKRVKSAAGSVGYGLSHPVFWLMARRQQGAASAGFGLHVALGAENRGAVDEFHRAALAAGGVDNGAPGLRPEYHPSYYGAFVLDPDGIKIEAVCHRKL
jgi:catechol 2,3-dioxygenase-like lactoylglutathione lyase family enzyme